jgi:hypothetical protein
VEQPDATPQTDPVKNGSRSVSRAWFQGEQAAGRATPYRCNEWLEGQRLCVRPGSNRLGHVRGEAIGDVCVGLLHEL